MKHVVMGVTGSIAAFKAAELCLQAQAQAITVK